MTDQTTPLRDRIAAALAREDAHNAGYDHGFATSYGADDETDGFVDAVLAVLPAPADQAAEIEQLREKHKASLRRADQINNELMEEVQRYADGKERPVLWSVYHQMHLRADNAEAEVERLRADQAAVLREAAAVLDRRASGIDAFSSSDFGEEARAVRELADAANELRRVADETATTETQAHPPLHQWRVEILDGDEWMPASGLRRDRSQAAEQLRMSSERRPLWNDGTGVQRRLVRETTTYTVEDETGPAAGARQDGAQ
ncbi:hypothetical protein TR631_33715 [Streptomyces rochei]|uniref:hypothetical protein n=1 Tax=Streptomyces rochei TaxID=1928 RepID=UPI002ACE2112|nr:hypothetical protein [Streptomyces rochei]WQC16521.1 hypothetical protein TR631_33715 [Streptomyces rochei]